MASPAQIEAFAWWLAQDHGSRQATDIVAQFGCSLSTAQKWLVGFNKSLQDTLSKQAASRLREKVDEYNLVQDAAIASAVILANMAHTRANEMQMDATVGKLPDPDEMAKLASTIKTVYSLAESASGADVAKRRASQKPVSGGKGDGKLALPDLGAFFLAESVEVETLGDVIASGENGSINESGNESGSASAEMPEK